MASTKRRLTARTCDTLSRPGRYGDGARSGLWFRVGENATKSWVFRYMRNGRAREMGLGPYPVVSLAEARDAALEAKRLLFRGLDPLDARAEARKAKPEPVGAVAFEAMAREYVAAQAPGWRSPKQAAQWLGSFEAHVFPALGAADVAAITADDVLAVLKPIWLEVPETASRIRGRIERVLDAAKARGLRTGENPARWRGRLDSLLPKRSKVRAVEHHRALPWAELPGFMARLRRVEGMGARALEFAILTAARSGEVRGATWREIDLEAGVWTVPAGRMKAGRPHRVPLSGAALALLRAVPRFAGSEYVFPAARGGVLSDMTISAVTRRMGADAVPHGFRSSFRTWAAEATDFPREVAEAALAHVLADKVEAAYRRTDLFDRRRELMDAWAAHCEG